MNIKDLAVRYYRWVAILAVIVAALAFSRMYLGATKDRAFAENKQISGKFKEFTAQYQKSHTGLRQTPTQQDIFGGRDFINAIIAERSRALTLLKMYATAFDRDLVDGEVVYAENMTNAGKPVDEMTFADFMTARYLEAMADAENSLFAAEKQFWRQAMLQNMYATTPSIREMSDIQAAANQNGDRVAAAQARFLTPVKLIPYAVSENFRGKSRQEKRWSAWRQYLIFRDILTRVVAKISARAKRDVVGFERATAEMDILDTLPTTIVPGRTERFVQNLDALRIELIKVGNATLPEPEIVPEGADGLQKERRKDVANFTPQNAVCFDVYRVTVQMTAYLDTINQFRKELLNTQEWLYVPTAAQFTRFADRETMGSLTTPPGVMPNAVQPTPEFMNSWATPVIKTADYSYEPPVQATLIYDLYRPRFAFSSNLQSVTKFDTGNATEKKSN
ncbi:MAG: hypothetical protein LBP75_10005 [Planctomycetota bacterium]|jgi:hypothetical protein|nr:hypothetical protein [Planctomycetota bacterium]